MSIARRSLWVTSDSIHVVAGCDTSGNCSPATHADGTLVSAKAPAMPGEVVVIYAWGLGYTSPGVPTGDLTPTSTLVVTRSPITVQFDFSPNAPPKFDFDLSPVIVNAYLTAGQVGLYQINVQLPSTFPAVLACGTYTNSNLTVDLRGTISSDGA